MVLFVSNTESHERNNGIREVVDGKGIIVLLYFYDMHVWRNRRLSRSFFSSFKAGCDVKHKEEVCVRMLKLVYKRDVKTTRNATFEDTWKTSMICTGKNKNMIWIIIMDICLFLCCLLYQLCTLWNLGRWKADYYSTKGYTNRFISSSLVASNGTEYVWVPYVAHAFREIKRRESMLMNACYKED